MLAAARVSPSPHHHPIRRVRHAAPQKRGRTTSIAADADVQLVQPCQSRPHQLNFLRRLRLRLLRPGLRRLCRRRDPHRPHDVRLAPGRTPNPAGPDPARRPAVLPRLRRHRRPPRSRRHVPRRRPDHPGPADRPGRPGRPAGPIRGRRSHPPRRPSPPRLTTQEERPDEARHHSPAAQTCHFGLSG
jgi:hypothetical protein